MLLPRVLRPGDLIGIAAPASPPDADAVQRGTALLEARGYRVRLGKHLFDAAEQCGYLAGRDEDRAADLNALFAEPEVAAIFCVRGGYGTMRLLKYLDWNVLGANPKIFVGYSDITSLHLAIHRRLSLVTFHGPMLSALPRCSESALAVFWNLLERPESLGTLPADPALLQTVVSGSVTGALTGGCLSLLAAACGTYDAPDFCGKIVVMEDVGEAVYRADRCLMQLFHAGHLAQAAGFVLGSLTGWREHEPFPERNTPAALWRDTFGPLQSPALSGFPFGHEPDPLTLPLGIRARLDADARTLTLLEAATVSRS